MLTPAALVLASLFLAFVGGAAYLAGLRARQSAARKGAWRTQEGTLHFFGVIGGWPGALAAQRLLRHKSKKRSFQAVFWIMVARNV